MGALRQNSVCAFPINIQGYNQLCTAVHKLCGSYQLILLYVVLCMLCICSVCWCVLCCVCFVYAVGSDGWNRLDERRDRVKEGLLDDDRDKGYDYIHHLEKWWCFFSWWWPSRFDALKLIWHIQQTFLFAACIFINRSTTSTTVTVYQENIKAK